ncbi:THUMP domain-containing class I SAM-dependent RNA methyltransferase [Longimicrobium terrae]|uniref:Putative N6-adenine-specific DNA methylase n=1 Tax=Longimicrobium terrae TaxID=1639882 RepID=A0A841GUE4_9BACT|nr:class I SAM-dependent RNA methyltransferase [Longimicrobium terrae]MBB4634132.1 putative N6-adenine-specific DNA methylase [Longimicrobium terrae]MBB6068978.1 putative N6-adenine-specific DNA methylase [Longimicrobium terrae]NNC28157.1 class I SAM-dependent RNA methyltransferase [Longimicrobium terrae]
MLDLFAITAPGLEPLAAAELRALGIEGVVEPGGVAWTGPAEQMHEANLRLRTASRVVVRAARFRARTFFELERHARKVPWARWIAPGGQVRLRVTSRKSKLYHEGAIAQRLLDAIARAVGQVEGGTVADDEADVAADAQLFIVRFVRDWCVISADSSGALLHLRGYRQALAKAPLRETLAAAMLLGSRWDTRTPLIDPMCGSGTIAIEAALMARGIVPGLAMASREPRAYAFSAWPDFDAAAWSAAVDRARGEILPSAPAPILGSDRDAGGIQASIANAERAGVGVDIGFSVRSLSAIEPPAEAGIILCNPPYGVRVGEREPLRNLYAVMGRTLVERAPGYTLGLLSADKQLEGHVGLPFREVFRTSNGGIPVHLVLATAD